MAHILEGLIIGTLLGLALRPVLDAYLVWRLINEYRAESQADSRRMAHRARRI